MCLGVPPRILDSFASDYLHSCSRFVRNSSKIDATQRLRLTLDSASPCLA